MSDGIFNEDFSFMKIYNKFCRTKEYMRFMRKAYSSTYYFLRASIVRESEEVKNNKFHPAHRMYKDYFLNGMLVGRYSQKNIAEYLSTSRTVIIKDIQELEKDGFIKVIKVKVKSGYDVNYYMLGTHEGGFGSVNYKESYLLDNYFDKLFLKEKEERDRNKNYEVYISVMRMCDTFDEFMALAGTKISEDELPKIRDLWAQNRQNNGYVNY